MRNNNARKKKVWRKKFAAIAAKDRELTVNNIPKTKPTFDKKSLVEVKFGEKDVHFMQKAEDWKNEKHPQPKRLQHSWKRKVVMYDEETKKFVKKLVHHRSDYIPYNKLKNEPFYDSNGLTRYPFPNKMPQHTYWERLTQHKLDKWKKKNPPPQTKEGELFENTEEIPYSVKLQQAEEKIREKVISIYHKLPLTARFKKAENKFDEVLVAELKDENGDGHHVNDLKPEKSKLLQKAQKITNKIHAKHSNLVCTNLRDHKRRTGRVILPEMRQAA